MSPRDPVIIDRIKNIKANAEKISASGDTLMLRQLADLSYLVAAFLESDFVPSERCAVERERLAEELAEDLAEEIGAKVKPQITFVAAAAISLPVCVGIVTICLTLLRIMGKV